MPSVQEQTHQTYSMWASGLAEVLQFCVSRTCLLYNIIIQKLIIEK
jgi:hypothetical protein